jgi:hypothetical protein
MHLITSQYLFMDLIIVVLVLPLLGGVLGMFRIIFAQDSVEVWCVEHSIVVCMLRMLEMSTVQMYRHMQFRLHILACKSAECVTGKLVASPVCRFLLH